ncbi:hypothetical protein GRF29_112g259749, partial [Pseudopithomyces chartarum]
TAENDRLLLLKLIETHGISVNSKLIADAWPDDVVKPTARAITERFVTLRRLAGLKVSIGTGGTPGKARTPRSSKYTTPKKRKARNDGDESDAEKDVTDQESPTKKPAHFSGGSRARGTRGARGGQGPAIKTEPSCLVVELPADPFDAQFQADAAEAARIRQSSEMNPFGAIQNNGTNRSLLGFASFNGHQNPAGFAPSNNGFVHHGYAPAVPPPALSMPQHGVSLHGLANHVQGSVQGYDNGYGNGHGNGYGNGNGNEYRARSARKASAQATEGVAAYLSHQKNEDEALGVRSEGEDSQVSEYHDVLDEFV